MTWCKILLSCALVLGLALRSAGAAEVRAAVASNFAAPMKRLAMLFQRGTGHTVKYSLGSSGKLATQIRQGAPFDVFLAADEKGSQWLEREGLTVRGSRFVYAQGKLALWSRRPAHVDARGEILRADRFAKLAIADPKVAPYGRAAQETLQRLGRWEAVQGRLVTGENITQTYQFAASGNADLAFVSWSQIVHDGRVPAGSWWVVPPHFHQPIRQSAVLLAGAKDKPAASAFLDFLKSDQARKVMQGSGYDLP